MKPTYLPLTISTALLNKYPLGSVISWLFSVFLPRIVSLVISRLSLPSDSSNCKPRSSNIPYLSHPWLICSQSSLRTFFSLPTIFLEYRSLLSQNRCQLNTICKSCSGILLLPSCGILIPCRDFGGIARYLYQVAETEECIKSSRPLVSKAPSLEFCPFYAIPRHFLDLLLCSHSHQ